MCRARSTSTPFAKQDVEQNASHAHTASPRLARPLARTHARPNETKTMSRLDSQSQPPIHISCIIYYMYIYIYMYRYIHLNICMRVYA